MTLYQMVHEPFEADEPKGYNFLPSPLSNPPLSPRPSRSDIQIEMDHTVVDHHPIRSPSRAGSTSATRCTNSPAAAAEVSINNMASRVGKMVIGGSQKGKGKERASGNARVGRRANMVCETESESEGEDESKLSAVALGKRRRKEAIADTEDEESDGSEDDVKRALLGSSYSRRTHRRPTTPSSPYYSTDDTSLPSSSNSSIRKLFGPKKFKSRRPPEPPKLPEPYRATIPAYIHYVFPVDHSAASAILRQNFYGILKPLSRTMPSTPKRLTASKSLTAISHSSVLRPTTSFSSIVPDSQSSSSASLHEEEPDPYEEYWSPLDVNEVPLNIHHLDPNDVDAAGEFKPSAHPRRSRVKDLPSEHLAFESKWVWHEGWHDNIIRLPYPWRDKLREKDIPTEEMEEKMRGVTTIGFECFAKNNPLPTDNEDAMDES